MIAVLCGGVGAARLLTGLVQVVEEEQLAAVVNTGDDAVMHGLYICPDLDTITYTLSGSVNPATGWGLEGESWQAMEALERIGGPERTWFRLGDRDLGTHLYRTGRLAEGASLTEVSAEIARAFGLRLRLLPMSDDPVRTELIAKSGGRLAFQEYFVQHRHEVAVEAVSFLGAEEAAPSPAAMEALARADLVVVAPSNPVVSIGPILALPGVSELLSSRRESVVAVSPIVGGKALKGPADRLLVELGGQASAAGVAARLARVAATLVIDEGDSSEQGAVSAAGMRPVLAPAVMSDGRAAAVLAEAVLAAAGPLG